MSCKCDESSNTPTPLCGTPSTFNPCLSLLTPQQEQQLRSAVRPTSVNPVIAALAAGASTAAITIAAKSTFWTFSIDDFVSSLSNMDGMQLLIGLDGVTLPNIDVFGGKFARGTSNPCTPCADRAFCVGPLNTVVISVKNITGAAFAATDTATLQYRPIYSGEVGFICGPCGTKTGFTVQGG